MILWRTAECDVYGTKQASKQSSNQAIKRAIKQGSDIVASGYRLRGSRKN